MLMRFGKLSKDQEIGAALMNAGLLTMALSLALAVWVLRVMATARAPSVTTVSSRDGRPGKARLYTPGEEERLGAFLEGRPVERVAPRRIFKRSTGASGQVEPERARGEASAGRGAPPASEDERFRKFLERDGRGGRP